MSGLATPWLVIVFAAGAGVTWVAGISLSKTTDALDVPVAGMFVLAN